MRVDDHGVEYEAVLFAGQFVYERGENYAVRSRTDWAVAVNEEEVGEAEVRACRLADCRSVFNK